MACESAWRSFDDQLINVVKNYTVLYDVTLKDFKNNTVKENAWARLSAEVGINGMYLSHASWCVLQKITIVIKCNLQNL